MPTELPQYVQRQQIDQAGIRRDRPLPYGLTALCVADAMNDVLDYLHHVNRISVEQGYERLEELMLGNTYSGFLSELLVKAIARRCPTLVRNTRIGGHPDLLPTGVYPKDAVLHGNEGVEVKVSLQAGGWQGHHPEEAWVMIFQISVDRLSEPVQARHATQFEKAMLARLQREHWSFSGRRGESRRTPTASILQAGTALLHAGAIYERPGYVRTHGAGRATRVIAEGGARYALGPDAENEP